MTSQGITLQDKIDAMKKKKEQENESKSDYENNKNKEIERSIEILDQNVKYLTELIENNQNRGQEKEDKPSLDLSDEPFRTLNKNDHAIYKKVKNLESGVHDELVELHQKTLNESISRLEEQYKEHEKKIDKILNLKAISSITLYFVSTVLLALILARVAIYGVWQGLGLNMLFNMSEWYFQLLGVVLFFGIIAGSMILVINGVENIRRRHF